MLRRIFIAVLALSVSACASFRGGQLEPIEGWPPSDTAKKSVSYVLTGKITLNEKVADMQPAALDVWKKSLDNAYTESKAFSSVKEGFSDTDVRAEVSITDTGNGSMFLAFLSGFTFGVIPSYANDEIVVKTTFKDKNGSVIGEVAKKEDVSMWIHLILLPATPFAFPTSVVNDVHYDLHRATLLEARKKGII